MQADTRGDCEGGARSGVAESLAHAREPFEKENGPQTQTVAGRRLKDPAMTYFRTFRHYHRPEELNGRVRNGNVCFLLGKVTGKRPGRRQSDAPGPRAQ